MPRGRPTSKRNTATMSPAQKLRARVKALKQKLSDTTASFKQRLKAVEASAQAKAIHHVMRVLSKKSAAKLKALEAAEAKFEKQYAKKFAKKLPLFTHSATTSSKTATSARKGRKGRRGRPRKAA